MNTFCLVEIYVMDCTIMKVIAVGNNEALQKLKASKEVENLRNLKQYEKYNEFANSWFNINPCPYGSSTESLENWSAKQDRVFKAFFERTDISPDIVTTNEYSYDILEVPQV